MMPPCNVISDTSTKVRQTTWGCAAVAAAATAVTAAASDCSAGRTHAETSLYYRSTSVASVSGPTTHPAVYLHCNHVKLTKHQLQQPRPPEERNALLAHPAPFG